jgi:hypothetical protein
LSPPTVRETAESTGANVKPRRWLRFSLRTLLVLVTLACIWLGMVVNRAEQQRRTVAAFRALGNRVEYDTPYTNPRGEPSNWRWLRSWLGNDYFDSAYYVGLSHGVDDELLHRVRCLRGVRRLDVMGPKVTDEGMAAISRVSTLETLAVHAQEVTDEGVRHLSRMRKLRGLFLWAPKVTDRGAKSLAKLEDLDGLSLHDTQVTDDGLMSLCSLTNLSKLRVTQQTRSLKRRQITDKGVYHVSRFTKLTDLSLDGNRITDQGLMQLASLQNLRRLDVECFRPKYSVRGIKTLQVKLPLLTVRHSAWEPTWEPVTDESTHPVFEATAKQR